MVYDSYILLLKNNSLLLELRLLRKPAVTHFFREAAWPSSYNAGLVMGGPRVQVHP